MRLTKIISVCALLGVSSCASWFKREAPKPIEKPRHEEISLKEDRDALEELRKEIPDERKLLNDQLAAIIKDMNSEKNLEPSSVRSRFQREVRLRRERLDQKLRRDREQFNQDEKIKREKFLEELKTERQAYTRRALSATGDREEARRLREKFYQDQDVRRRQFFAQQTDQRRDFESQQTSERRDFEAYIREITNQFNHEWRNYSRLYQERRQAEGLKKRQMPKTQTEGLGPGPSDTSAVQKLIQDDLERARRQQAVPIQPPSAEGQ